MREVDAAQLPLMLTTLRLPTIGRLWHSFAERADSEGWGAARYLAALCEHELAERTTRRIARHLAQSGLPQGKMECAPGAGQNQAAVLTVCRAWWSSNWAGLR